MGNLLERSIGHPNDHEVFSSSISKKSATSCFAVPFVVNATPGGKEEVERLERRMDGSPASTSTYDSSFFPQIIRGLVCLSSSFFSPALLCSILLFLLLSPQFPPSPLLD